MTTPQYPKPSVQPVWGNTNTSATDMVEPPTIAGGEASMPTGFLESTTAPARQFFNWLFNYVMNGTRYFSQRGLADWDAAESYYQGSRVQATDGNTYVCTSAGPITSNPVTGGQTDWVQWGFTKTQLAAQGVAQPGDVKYTLAQNIANNPGWIVGTGQALARVGTYAALFAAITGPVSGATTSGNNVLNYTGSLPFSSVVGFYISGPGISGGNVTISASSGTTLTLSANATATESAGTVYTISPWPLGDGSTTFNVEDLRAVVIRGWDAAGGAARGLDSGRVMGSFQADAIKSHTITITDPGHSHGVTDPSHTHLIGGEFTNGPYTGTGATVLGIPGSNAYTIAAYTGVSVNAAYTGISASYAGATETRMANVALVGLIKY